MRKKLAVVAVVAAGAWFLPYGLDSYAIHVANVILIFAVLAIGLGLCMGVAGQVNLAQVAFFGVGAYATAILTTKAGLGFWVAAVLAIAATVAVGLVVGTPALRVQSHYLGIVTLGLALAFTNWVTNAQVSGGAEGISSIPGPALPGVDLDSEYLYYYLELIVFALALAFGLFLVRTRLGRRMRAMRDDSLAAGALGAEVPQLRMAAFLLASVYGGVGGVLYAGLIRYVAPESFGIANMFLLLGMVIIGGRQSLIGCVVGAVGLALVREGLVDHPTVAQVAYGAVVVLVVVFAPTGLAGLPARVRAALARRRQRQGAAARLGPFQPYPAAGSRSSGRPMLDVSGVTMQFRGLRALDEVSLTVSEGEIRGIVGPNGSGKTTLFNVVSGLYRPTAGHVRFRGQDMTGSRPYRLARAGMSRTFQNLRLFGDLTVEENVLVALDRSPTLASWRYLLGPISILRQDRALRRQAGDLLDRYGLTEFAQSPPRSLPYGIQRRVEIARAVAAAPSLLLLDEPAAGLNGEEVRQLSEIVRSIRDSGITVIVIEHNMGLVMSLCERITVLAGGRVIAEGEPADVAATPAVIEAYLGDSMSTDDLPSVPEVTA
ncbi:branched-chain amino acid ABC transporter ATP-binding protein/permease [Actinoplanes sp. NBRC 103695]|uniref:branched-chain amino acid ABC transporter ATP-binding protein/permease n=1 Tax=Actinoplanes sp. NBRC 103695 TaxID=3032202 RepID=UPI0024A01717|nr:branched-chain amino acid ABC transporter ATP-binding protein/permease [Actinoplanes sp. NBRC 103695]GLZ01243.1 branched-chain amino acid ABC transporter permease [Actinoplanes sp. NBRC 103695]